MKYKYEILTSIRPLVENDELVAAVDLVCSLSLEQNSSTKNEISALKGRLSRLERELRMGSLKYEDISAEKTRIALALLGIADVMTNQSILIHQV